MIHGFHYKSQQSFLQDWERRRKRFNESDYLIMKILYDESDVEEFRSFKFEKKIGIYCGNITDENIISLKFGEKDKVRYAYQFAGYVFAAVASGKIYEYVDIFKILSGETGAKRINTNV